MKTAQIEKLITVLQNHFEAEILKGNYSITKITQHTAEIVVAKYPFVIWIANGPSHLKSYDDRRNTIYIGFDSIFIEEKQTIFDRFQAQRLTDKNSDYMKAKKAELEALKKELGEV